MNNQLTLIGHVGKTPKAVSFGDTGNKVAKFSIAVKEYSNKEEESTMWIDVDAWNGLSERVMQYITKGREVALTGRLTINHYNKEVDGVNVEVTKPVLNLSSFHLCGPKPQAEEAPAETSSAKPKRGSRKSK